MVNPARSLGKSADAQRAHRSRDDVGGELILDEGDAVAQEQLALLEPLNLQRIRPDRVLQRPDGGVEVPVLLLQAHQRRAELAFFLFGHRRCAERLGIFRQKAARTGAGDGTVCRRKCDQIKNFWLQLRPRAGNPAMVAGKYPVLPFWLQAEWQFGYELGDLL